MMRYQVKGQEKNSHAVLPVDELVILQSTAPNAEAQAQSHKSRNSENLHRRLTPRPPPLSGKKIKRLST